jgi:alkaline phosphatase
MSAATRQRGLIVLMTICGFIAIATTSSIPKQTVEEESTVDDADHYHVKPTAGAGARAITDSPWYNTNWTALADQELAKAIQVTSNPINNAAKNVIMFLGDGMGLSTIAAARLYQFKLRSLTKQNIYLSWENFPHAALSRTYNVDRSTPDSAGTATAYLCGIKANMATIGVNDKVAFQDCSTVAANKARSIVKESVVAGKWTGVVTTTRITHASPAGAYAHTPDRDWEGYVPTTIPNYQLCQDIALQLITDSENQQIRVILGGGRSNFYPNNETDIEYPIFTGKGSRRDGRYLVKEWLAAHSTGQFVRNKTEFDAVNPATAQYLLGLFNPSHMDYEYDRAQKAPTREPSLADMTEKAIRILQKGPKGYFLFVEGGRIDHSHHDTSAFRALNDTLALSDAVQRAVSLTNETDTMIVVTADHSHVFTLGGYASFTPSVLDFTDGDTPADNKPMLQLHYGNGPGYTYHRTQSGVEVPRKNLTGVDVRDPTFQQDAAIPIGSETHGGEDVGIFARGPMSHLFHSVHEQNYIARLMMYASCVGGSLGPHCTGTARK